MNQNTAQALKDKKTSENKKPLPKPIYHIENRPTTGRVERFLEAFDVILKHTNYRQVLDMYLASSMRCSKCSVMCQVYEVTKDPRDIPCYRTHLLLGVYNRYFKAGGWIKGLISGSGILTEAKIDEMIEASYRCTACRRCVMECPMGIDHGLMTHLMRYVFGEMNMGPRALVISTREQLEGATHNTSAIPVPALQDTLEFLEEEIEEMKGVKVKFPLDKENVEWAFFPAVSDFMMEAETLMGNAVVMHAAGDADNWTIGTHNYDGINYGLFYSDWILDRVVNQLLDEAHRLKAQKIMIGECGHASRSAKNFVPVFGRDKKMPVINCMEYTWEKIQEGKIKLDPNVIKERVTYHDPCNIARKGWIIDTPRKIIRSFINDFVEKKHYGKDSLCCGGGGGTVSIDEIHEFRMEVTGKMLADELRETGAEYVIAPCANCKKQIKELIDYWKIPAKLVGLHDLILEAIIMK